MLDLYHRTTAQAAHAILATGRFVSWCQNPTEAYFTNRVDGPASRTYGEVVVQVEVPAAAAVVDESFGDGEVFYRVALAELARARVVGAFTLAPDGTRVPVP